MFLKTVPLIGTAYCLIIIGIILKSCGLYYLVTKKGLPIEKRKKIYLYLNWPANILIILGVIILAIKWYM